MLVGTVADEHPTVSTEPLNPLYHSDSPLDHANKIKSRQVAQTAFI